MAILRIKRIYYISAEPEPFTDANWFEEARQHTECNPALFPPLQLTMISHPNHNSAKMISKGQITDPSTPVSIIISLNGARDINRPTHSWICMSKDTMYHVANYYDIGLVHRERRSDVTSYTNKLVTRTIGNTRRFYLVPMDQNLMDRIGPEIIEAAF